MAKFKSALDELAGGNSSASYSGNTMDAAKSFSALDSISISRVTPKNTTPKKNSQLYDQYAADIQAYHDATAIRQPLAFGASGATSKVDTTSAKQKYDAAVKGLKSMGATDEDIYNIEHSNARKYTNEAIKKVLLRSDADIQKAVEQQKMSEAERERRKTTNLADIQRSIDEQQKIVDAERGKSSANIKAMGGYDPTQVTMAQKRLAELKQEYNLTQQVQQEEKDKKTIADVDKLPTEAKDAVKALIDIRNDPNNAQYKGKPAYSGLDMQLMSMLHSMGYSGEYIQEVMQAYEREGNRAKSEEQRDKYLNDAVRNPVGASVKSVGTNLGSGFGYLENVGDLMSGRPVDYNNLGNRMGQYAQGVRGTVSENLAQQHPFSIAGTNVSSFLYQTGMSMADSSVVAAMSLAGLPEAYGLVLLGGSAANQTMQDAHARGLDDTQAATLGLVAGAAEVITEKVSLDTLLDAAGWNKNAAKQYLKQVLAEGSEEVGADLINWMADVLVSKEQSEWEQSIQNHVAQGDDVRTAFGKAFGEQAGQMAGSFVGGALSGGVFGVGGLTYNASNRIQQNRAFDQALNKLYAADPRSMVQTGLTAESGSQFRQLSDKYNKVLEDGGELNADDIRQLSTAAAENWLTDKGSAENAAAVAESIAKKQAGEKLNRQDKKNLKSPAAKSYLENAARGSIFRTYGSEVSNDTAEGENAAESATGASVAIKNAVLRDAVTKARNGESVTSSIVKNIAANEEAMSELGIDTNGMTASEIRTEVRSKVESIASGEAQNVIQNTTAEAVETESASAEYVSNDAITAVAKEYGMSEDSVRDIRDMFKGNMTSEQLRGATQAYRMGRFNIPASEMDRYNVAQGLTKEQRAYAYNRGAIDNKSSVSKAQNAKKVIKNAKGKGGLVYEGIEDPTKKGNLNAQQRTGLRVAEALSQWAGGTVHVYESVVKDGKRVMAVDIPDAGIKAGESAPNGMYIHSSGEIWIDLAAGQHGEGVILYTLAHEYTHMIRAWSPAKFDTLAKFLFDQYASNGVSVSELIARQQAKAKKNGRNIPYDEAYEEAVADAMERMLADEHFADRIAELKKTDKTLWEKLKDLFKRLIDALGKANKAYKDISPTTHEAYEASRFTKSAQEHLAKLYAEAFVDAAEARSSAESVGVEIDEDTESANPDMFSERTWNESDYVQDVEEASKDLAKALNISKEKAKAYIESVNSVARMIADDRVRLDYQETGLSPFISNVEYGGSFDYTTLCKKRRLLTGTFSAIQKALKNSALTAQEILEIRKMMDDAGLEVSCGKCYVEGSRANMGKFTQQFIELYKKYNPGAWYPNMAEMNTPDGIEWVRITHPEVYEQYEYFWNHYGTLKPGDPNLFASQQKPKLYQMRSAYNGEVLKNFKGDDKAKIAEKNKNGGIRMQSFSDFEIVHLIDAMQTIMDMSRVGLHGQAYTKVPDFAWALGNTGMKINLSIDAWSVGEDGKLVFNNKEGMPFDTAMELRNAYSKNVGTICCVYDDAQLLAALADDRIDFIIPFHRSQWKKAQYKAMGLPQTTKDYTYQQNEKWIDPSKHTHEFRGRQVRDKCQNYMPNEYWDFSKSGKENAEEYLRMCAKDGKRPKFYKFLDKNTDGSYSLKKDGSTDGYWKLLIDFKMYDNEGNGSPQMPVRPDFNMDECHRMLKEYEGGHEKFPVAQGIVDEFVSKYKENHSGVSLSDRDSEGKRMEDDIAFSAREALSLDIPWDKDNFSSLKEQLIAHQDEINNTKIIANVEYDENSPVPFYDRLNTILKKNFGYKISRPDISDILFDKTAISNVRRYNIKSNGAKAAVIASPYIVKRGKMITGHKNHENNGYPSITFAGRASLNGEVGNIAVAVLFADKDRVHALKILAPDGSEFVLPIKKEASSEREGVPEKTVPRTPTELTSDSSIPQTATESQAESSDNNPHSDRGNGYDGYSMSNNARDAYENGEKPISKWTKAEILNAVKDINPDAVDILKGVSTPTLKAYVLRKSSWHHTSSMYNKTDFYAVDESIVENLTRETVDSWTPVTKVDDTNTYRGDFDYVEWSGTRNHPKAEKKSLKNVNIEEKGSFYTVTDDDGNVLVRKKIGSNGTYATNYETVERYRQAAEEREKRIIDNSSPEAAEMYRRLKRDGYESSSSGSMYEKGRKPSQYEYAMGLDKFFSVGEKRLTPNENGGFSVETWDGTNWSIEDTSFSYRDSDSLDNQTLLTNAKSAKTAEERDMLNSYMSTAKSLNYQEEKLTGIMEEIRSLDPTQDAKKIAALEREGYAVRKVIEQRHNRLVQLERTKALRDLVKRERSMAVAKQRQKGETALAAQAARSKAKQDAIIEKYRTQRDETVAKVREKSAQREQEIKDTYRERIKNGVENRKASSLRESIRKTANDFRQMILHATDSKYAPTELMQSCLDVALMLDTSGEREDTKSKQKFRDAMEAIREIKSQYEELQNNPDSDYSLEYDHDFAYMVGQLEKSLKGKAVRDLTLDELQDVHDILHDIKAMLQDAKKQIGKADNVTNYSVGESIINDMGNVGTRTKAEAAIDEQFRLTGSTLRNIRRISNYDDNAALVRLFNDINDGIKKKNQFIMEAEKMFDQFTVNSKRYKQSVNEVKDYKTGGRTFKLTEMEAIQLVLTWERERGGKTNHLERDGAVIPNHELLKKGKYADAFAKGIKYDHITEDEILGIQKSFDEWANNYKAVAKTFFNVKAKTAINNTTLLTKHRAIALTENYIPIEVDRNYIAAELEGVKFDATIEGMGMLKSVKEGAGNPIIIRGLHDVVRNHADRVGQLYGLAVPIRNFNKAFSIRELGTGETPRSAIADAWTQKDVQLIEQAITDLQTPRRRATDALSKIAQKMQGRFVEATLLSNISVTIKQAASYSTAGLYLSQKALAPYQGTIAKIFANNESKFAKNLFAEIDAHTSEHYIRRKGMSMQEISTIANDTSKVVGWMDETLPDAANPLKWIQNMDVATTAALWLAAKKQVELDGIKPSDSSYWEKVTSLYEKVIEDTQPMYDVLHRPEVQKTTNELVRSIIMFRTQPLQNSGILYNAASELAHAKKSGNQQAIAKASKQMKMAVGSQVASLAVFAAMTFLAYAVRNRLGRYKDKDEELTVWSVMGRVLGDMASNGAALALPIGGSTLSGIVEKKITGSRFGGEISVPVVDMVNDYIKSYEKVFGDISDWDSKKGDFAQDLMSLSMDTAGMFGIPANNVYNIVRGVIGNVTDIAGVPLDWATDKSRNYSTQMYNAAIRGDTAKEEKARANYDTEKAADDAFRGEVMKSYEKGKINRDQALKLLMEHGGMKKDAAEEKILNADFKKEYGFSYSDLGEKYIEGVITKEQYKSIQKEHGFKDDEISKKLLDLDFKAKYGFSYDDKREAYWDGDISKADITKALIAHGKTQEEADDIIKCWDFSKGEGNMDDITVSAVKKYNEFCVQTGMTKSAYYSAWSTLKDFTGEDLDGDGKSDPYTKMDKQLAYIGSLSLSREQKFALALASGIKESSINKRAHW